MKNEKIEPKMIGQNLFRLMAYPSIAFVFYVFISSTYYGYFIGGLYALFILSIVALIVEVIIMYLNVRMKDKYRGEIIL